MSKTRDFANVASGLTATATELNYTDITTLGTSEASKAVTADGNGVVTFDNGIGINNEGTGNGVFIDQNGDGTALYIDSESVSNPAINISAVTDGIWVGSTTTGDYDYGVYSYLSAAKTTGTANSRRAIFGWVQNAGDTLSNAGYFQNEGSGTGVFIDQNGNGTALNIDHEGSTAFGLYVQADALTSGYGASIAVNSASHSGAVLAALEQNASATGIPLFVQNAGSGNGVFIDQNGNGTALNIDSEASTANVATFDGAGITTGRVINASINNGSFSGDVIYASVGGGTGKGINVLNQGTGTAVFIDQNGNGTALNIDSESSTAIPVTVTAPVANQILLLRNEHATTPIGVKIDFSVATPDNLSQHFLYCEDATTLRAVCYSNGNWYNHDGVYGTISDAKLKTDIQDARSYWDDFKALQYRKYKIKADIEKYGDETGYRLGLVAQEAEAVFPGCVSETPDMEEVVVDTIERPVMEDVVIPAEFDEDGNEVSPERTEQKAKKDEDGNDVVEIEEVKESKQKVDADGNLQVTKVVKSSIIEGPILAKVLQEAMKRIEALEAEIAALKSA